MVWSVLLASSIGPVVGLALLVVVGGTAVNGMVDLCKRNRLVVMGKVDSGEDM